MTQCSDHFTTQRQTDEPKLSEKRERNTTETIELCDKKTDVLLLLIPQNVSQAKKRCLCSSMILTIQVNSTKV